MRIELERYLDRVYRMADSIGSTDDPRVSTKDRQVPLDLYI